MSRVREQAHLLHFQETFESFPVGDVEKTENPDRIVHTPQHRIGIEHTELFHPGPSHGHSLQAQDGLARRIVDEAEKLFSTKCSQPLLVQIRFMSRSKMGKQDVGRIAEMICHLVDDAVADLPTFATLTRTPQNAERFPAEVSCIEVVRQSRDTRWCCSGNSFVRELSPEQLQATIDKKEQKVNSYREKCAEIWLLIVADDVRPPSTLDLAPSAVTHPYATTFDRVFVFWDAKRKYVELALRQPPLM
jgi:hypothetical protein